MSKFTDGEIEKLEEGFLEALAIKEALHHYHLALDQRRHGGEAGIHLIEQIQRTLGHWIPGAALEKEAKKKE